MAITLKRQIDDEEKQIILKRHGRKCFATGHDIPATESVHFDHIRAFALGGESALDNIAPMCEHHNKAKGTLSLGDFRIKLRLEDFFKQGDRLTLRHLFEYLKKEDDIASFGDAVTVTERDGHISLQSHSHNSTHDLWTCERTGWKYFYATLPVSVLNSDDDENHQFGLQPRFLIFDKVFDLYRHFQIYPVLQPSIGRIHDDNVLLFDGQHKAAALLWSGRRSFECKIYIRPDVRILNQTNIAAHDKFAQTRFFSSVMILKLGSQFGKDFEDYRKLEDGTIKSEVGFLDYLAKIQDAELTRGERNKRFRSYLYNSILEDTENLAKPLVSTSNRSSSSQPITVDMLSKSLFACFLFTDPVEDSMTSDAYKREYEFQNNIRLLNILFGMALHNWNPKALRDDTEQHRLNRIFSSKSIMAWSELLRDAVCAKLDLEDADDRAKPFYRELCEADFQKIKKIVERLIGWPLWLSPMNSDIDTQLAGNKRTLKEWFRSKGLTTGYLMGANE
ncbi:MAG: HNH endonuclease [Actinobacteria bacterium]|nr:HNH endonuclease [Actinomycetota bacterium]